MEGSHEGMPSLRTAHGELLLQWEKCALARCRNWWLSAATSSKQQIAADKNLVSNTIMVQARSTSDRSRKCTTRHHVIPRTPTPEDNLAASPVQQCLTARAFNITLSWLFPTRSCSRFVRIGSSSPCRRLSNQMCSYCRKSSKKQPLRSSSLESCGHRLRPKLEKIACCSYPRPNSIPCPRTLLYMTESAKCGTFQSNDESPRLTMSTGLF